MLHKFINLIWVFIKFLLALLLAGLTLIAVAIRWVFLKWFELETISYLRLMGWLNPDTIVWNFWNVSLYLIHKALSWILRSLGDLFLLIQCLFMILSKKLWVQKNPNEG